MIEFFTSSTFRTVLSALNSGFLKTLQLFFITLIGALPLGLVISFGSMSRLAPFARPVHWFLRRRERGAGRNARALRHLPAHPPHLPIGGLGHPGHASGAANHCTVLCARHPEVVQLAQR